MTEEQDNVTNLFDFKVKKLSDEDLVNDCLMHLRCVEMGLMSDDHVIRAKQLFAEAITRPQLEFIANDFKVALKVIDKLFPSKELKDLQNVKDN